LRLTIDLRFAHHYICDELPAIGSSDVCDDVSEHDDDVDEV